MATKTATEGERITFTTYRCTGEGRWGRTYEQDQHEGVIQKIIYWADNSIDATVLCDDGETRTTQLMFPHGDACF